MPRASLHPTPHHKSPPWPACSLPPAELLAAVSVPLYLWTSLSLVFE